MQIMIAEDEMLAASRLQHLLKECEPQANIVCCAESVEEAVDYLKQHAAPDLLLFDIQLSDGHSFEIFKRVRVSSPVIFTTAYDQYAIDAFKLFSIDYILKPVTVEALRQAIHKYRTMAASFVPADYAQLLSSLPKPGLPSYKSRFLAKVGQRLFFVQTEDVAYFQADNKLVYLVDKSGNRYLIDYTLERLESMLNPKEFFRLNRRFIVKVSAIEHVKPYLNSRLKLCIKGANQDDLIISRERVAEFKTWAEA